MFTVVMSIYNRDDPKYFIDAIQSVLNQSLPPSEVLIVVDGQVNTMIQAALATLSVYPVIRIIQLESNMGLGGARHIAIQQATKDIIAVMDSDDICADGRFQRQILMLKNNNLDVVGGYIEEFDLIPRDNPRTRLVAVSHDALVRRARWKNPMNHVTIMFRKSAYIAVGGYKAIRYVEDYDLFYRMIISGARFENIPENLVYVRCGKEVLGRRVGFSYFRSELLLFNIMRRDKFINNPQWMLNVCIRIFARAMPRFLLGYVYKVFLRSKNQN